MDKLSTMDDRRCVLCGAIAHPPDTWAHNAGCPTMGDADALGGTQDDRLSRAQLVLRDGRNDALSSSVAEARNELATLRAQLAEAQQNEKHTRGVLKAMEGDLRARLEAAEQQRAALLAENQRLAQVGADAFQVLDELDKSQAEIAQLTDQISGLRATHPAQASLQLALTEATRRQEALAALVLELASVYTVDTDQVALIGLAERARALLAGPPAPETK